MKAIKILVTATLFIVMGCKTTASHLKTGPHLKEASHKSSVLFIILED